MRNPNVSTNEVRVAPNNLVLDTESKPSIGFLTGLSSKASTAKFWMTKDIKTMIQSYPWVRCQALPFDLLEIFVQCYIVFIQFTIEFHYTFNLGNFCILILCKHLLVDEDMSEKSIMSLICRLIDLSTLAGL
jgi:hypothetical protein